MAVPGRGLPKSPPPAFVHVFLPPTLPSLLLLGRSLWWSIPPQMKLLRKAHLRVLVAASSSLCQGLGELLGPGGGWSPWAPGL